VQRIGLQKELETEDEMEEAGSSIEEEVEEETKVRFWSTFSIFLSVPGADSEECEQPEYSATPGVLSGAARDAKVKSSGVPSGEPSGTKGEGSTVNFDFNKPVSPVLFLGTD
jgi:hypothetical protein